MTLRTITILIGLIALASVAGLTAYWRHGDEAVPPPPQTVSAPGTPLPAPPVEEASRPVAVSPPSTPAAAAVEPAPSFDIARVEPDGSALVAGRTAPGREVELLANGAVLDRTKANEAGEFVISPPALSPGNHELLLRSGGQTSLKAVTVSVPQPGGSRDVLVVAGEPGKPSEIVQADAAVAAVADGAGAYTPASPTAATQSFPLKIAVVEAEAGQLFVQGTGPAGEQAQIYLNNQAVAAARIGIDGRWSLKVEKGIAAGEYQVRVDQIGQGGSVSARAEVPFSVGAQDSVATAAPAQAPPPPTRPAAGAADAVSVAAGPSPSDAVANPVITQLSTLQVQRGDNLWKIARQTYGRGIRYSTIYKANLEQIRNPRLIYPGQVFVMPPGQARGG
jgi:nucleoid-associated protein YgaU